jgi:hypothetical protein
MSSSIDGQVTETTAVRSWTERLIAGGAAAVAVALLLYFPDRDDGSGAILGGLCALIAVPPGLAAVAKHRPLPKRSIVDHVRLGALTLGLGIGVGTANLAANYGMAVFESAIHEQMVRVGPSFLRGRW